MTDANGNVRMPLVIFQNGKQPAPHCCLICIEFNLCVPRGTSSTAAYWAPVWSALANVEILSSPAWSKKRDELLKAIRKELRIPQGSVE